VAVLGLDDQVQVELDATIGAHPQIVDAVRPSRKAALEPPSGGSLQRSGASAVRGEPDAGLPPPILGRCRPGGPRLPLVCG
jgi:hypothetical protein